MGFRERETPEAGFPRKSRAFSGLMRGRLGKCIQNPSCLTPHHKKPGRAPAEKTAPLQQSRLLGRAPVGTMPNGQFTCHCGARKIYWHHLLGAVKG